MALQQNHLVTVVVDGRSLGQFERRSGGEVTGTAKTSRSAGMGPLKQRAGLPTYTDVTVSREQEGDYEETRWLLTRAGKAEMVVSDFLLDENGQRFGRPIVYTGKLQTVTAPDYDKDSTDDGTLTLVMTTRSVA